MFGLVPAGAHTHDEAAAAELIELGGHAPYIDGGTEGNGRDERAEAESLRLAGGDGERQVRLQRVLLAADEIVVGAEHCREPEPLRHVEDVDPALPGQAVLALDHQAYLHRFLLEECAC